MEWNGMERGEQEGGRAEGGSVEGGRGDGDGFECYFEKKARAKVKVGVEGGNQSHSLFFNMNKSKSKS